MRKIEKIVLVGKATLKKPYNPSTKILVDDILEFYIGGIQKDVYYSFGELNCESVFDTFVIRINKSEVNRRQIETILKPNFNVEAIKIIFEDGSVEFYNPSISCYEPEVDDFGEYVEMSIESV